MLRVLVAQARGLLWVTHQLGATKKVEHWRRTKEGLDDPLLIRSGHARNFIIECSRFSVKYQKLYRNNLDDFASVSNRTFPFLLSAPGDLLRNVTSRCVIFESSPVPVCANAFFDFITSSQQQTYDFFIGSQAAAKRFKAGFCSLGARAPLFPLREMGCFPD